MMKRVERSPARGVTLCHPARDDDQEDEKREPRFRECQEQEACPFSLMDSCHGRAGVGAERVRTWVPGKGERRAGTGGATTRGRKREKGKEKREKRKR